MLCPQLASAKYIDTRKKFITIIIANQFTIRFKPFDVTLNQFTIR